MQGSINETVLRSLAASSIATLLLIQELGTPPVTTRLEMLRADRYIIPNLDGAINLRTIFFRDSVGIRVLNEQGTNIAWTTPLARTGEPDATELPHLLKRKTGLAIEVLAKAIGVSKVTYHKWLNGAGISEDSRDRLREAISTFDTLATLRPNLRSFLDLQTSAGTPLELLSRRQDALVLGLATRGDATFSGPLAKQSVERNRLSQVRPIGWARTVNAERLEDLSPRARDDNTTADSPDDISVAKNVSYVLFEA